MKNQSITVIAVILAGLAAGCSPSEQTPAATDTNSTSSTSSTNSTMQTARDYADAAMTNTVNATTQAWADVKASFQSAMGNTYDQKNEFVDKANADLAVMDQKIQNLSDRAAGATGAAKDNLQSELQAVREKRSVLDQKLDQVKNATEADWDDAKASFQNAYDDTKTAIKNAWHSMTAN